MDDRPLAGPRAVPRAAWLISSALAIALGAAGSFVVSTTSACIYHDTCIRGNSPGVDWCSNLSNALQWPVDGTIDDAIPVLNGASPPRGCRCFNEAEHQILRDKVPACKYEAALAEIDNALRQKCQSLVLPGHNHNCWTAVGPQASVMEVEFYDGSGACIGNCSYGAPPLGGSCPDLNPYECATGEDGGVCPPEDGSGSRADETGSIDGGTASATGG